MNKTVEAISLTVPIEMRDNIDRLAKHNDRSVNKTVIRLIQAAKEYQEFLKNQ